MKTNIYIHISIFIYVIIFFSSKNIFAQQTLPLNTGYNQRTEAKINEVDSVYYHSGSKPFIQGFIPSSYSEYWSPIAPEYKKKNYFYRKLFKQSFVEIDSANYHITIDPVLNVSKGQDIDTDSNYYTNTRGILVKGEIGKHFAFTTMFAESQSFFPVYLGSAIKRSEVVPGQARYKSFKVNGFDYAYAMGNVSYSFLKHYNIQFGNGKNFIGHGYRSLILSDNAINYPQLKLTANFKKLQYQVIYTTMQIMSGGRLNISPGLTEPLFRKKNATFQYLSYIPFNRLELGLFQGTIFDAQDTGHYQYFNLSAANPLMLSNIPVYGLNNSNNVLLGLNIKIKVLKNTALYGQFVMDDIDPSYTENKLRNKYAYQAGLKSYKLFTVKNWFASVEYNRVRPFMYSAGNSAQSYSHNNQSLTHPLGANFNELIFLTNYYFLKNHLGVYIKSTFAQIGVDTLGKNNGTNIFTSNAYAVNGLLSESYTNEFGVKKQIVNHQVRLYYIVNTKTNLQIFAEYNIRTAQLLQAKTTENYFNIGIKTLLSDWYFDF